MQLDYLGMIELLTYTYARSFGCQIPEPAAPQKPKPKPIKVPPPPSFKKDNPFLTGGTSLMEQELDQGWKEWGQLMDEGTKKWDLDKIRQEAGRDRKERKNIAEAKANETFRPWKCYKPKK
ncbi:hypothetical protein EYC84_001756 [Monilinia fructicola]|uniref:Uncharacterized protein n=1 Tax=Monilinia fructicola TaxID=38448 RepID=A0A5M9JSW2_MONFR|nr:hypothetical protein EYC84_001756 [Monilinia fructicola]